MVYVPKATLPIECEIPSLKLIVELLPNTTPKKEQLLYLNKIDETHRDATLANEAHKREMKPQYDRSVQPLSLNEGEMVLTYDQKHNKLRGGNLESMWHGPYIVNSVLDKGDYELIDYNGIPLGEPRNGLYLKKYYA